LVSAALLCSVKGFIGRFEGRPWIGEIKHVRNASGKSNLAQWFIRLAVSQATFGHLFAQAVKFLMRFGQAEAPEQHNNPDSPGHLSLNRKNALFAGSDEGGDNWAVIATLIENCKLGAINPNDWLTQTLTALANGHPANRVHELMPWTAVG